MTYLTLISFLIVTKSYYLLVFELSIVWMCTFILLSFKNISKPNFIFSGEGKVVKTEEKTDASETATGKK